ncbi:glycosyltransferase family 4 protein [Candidatus Berkelbacteria bacterium]|nr:glycosyltransferase family 4 protein [Candidatus Berkelbacteria bacterium]MBI4029650.1 glycosyltransferase family 4 protein [Candidatus Berkelbacteria bacterium]
MANQSTRRRDRPLRIGLDGRFFRRKTAGLSRYTQELVKNLLGFDKQNQYVLFLTPDDKTEAEKLVASNLEKVIVPISHYSLSEQTKLPAILKKYNLDLMHFLNFNHPIFYSGKFIVTIHDLTMLYFPQGKSQKSFLRRLIMRWIFKHAAVRARRVIAVSKNTKNDFIKEFKAEPQKVKVIYEGAGEKLKSDTLTTAQIKKNLKLEKPFLLFVSQWRPHKGLQYLIRAFEILRQKLNQDILLVITGESNPHFPEIKKLLEQSAEKKSIITPGFVSDFELAALYQLCSVFVSPSLYEGFGLPQLEAAQNGAVVASSNLSCLPEILGKSALYFDPKDPQDMAQKINLLLTDRLISTKLKKEAEINLTRFSWTKTARETKQLYEEVANE